MILNSIIERMKIMLAVGQIWSYLTPQVQEEMEKKGWLFRSYIYNYATLYGIGVTIVIKSAQSPLGKTTEDQVTRKEFTKTCYKIAQEIYKPVVKSHKALDHLD